jgi:hypothetical protein
MSTPPVGNTLSSAARLAQNLLTIILRQIEDPTNPELCYSLPLMEPAAESDDVAG